VGAGAARFDRSAQAARRRLAVRGARACLDLFTLDEVEVELARFDIAAGVA